MSISEELQVSEPLLEPLNTRQVDRNLKAKLFIFIGSFFAICAISVFFLQRYSNQFETPEMFKIVLYGDSLTERGLYMNGFHAILNERNIRKADIINRGYGGYKTRDLIKNLQPITNNIQADLSFLLIGTNDAVTTPDGAAVEEYIENIHILVDEYQKHTKDLYLVTPPPTTDAVTRDNNHTALYRDALMIIGNKTEIPVIDTWKFIAYVDLDSNDGTHFNNNGNLKIANAYQNVIDSYNLKRFLP